MNFIKEERECFRTAAFHFQKAKSLIDCRVTGENVTYFLSVGQSWLDRAWLLYHLRKTSRRENMLFAIPLIAALSLFYCALIINN